MQALEKPQQTPQQNQDNVESAGSQKLALFRLIASDVSLQAYIVNTGAFEREMAVLGTVILDNEKFYETELSPLDFSNANTAVFWFTLSAMIHSGQAVDERGLAQAVAQARHKPREDCIAIVTKATGQALNDTLFPQYAQAIAEEDTRVRAIFAANQMAAAMKDRNKPLLQSLSVADNEWYKATNLPAKSSEGMTEVLAEVSIMLGEHRYLKTGWHHFDEWAGGFPVGNVVLWAGLSGEGKTTSLLDVVLYQLSLGSRVVVFLADTQGKAEIGLKLLAKLVGKEPDKMKPEDLNAEAVATMEGWKLALIDNIPLTPSNIKRRIKREERNGAVQLVIIEGLYLCYADDMSRSVDQALHIPQVMSQMIEFAKHKPYPIVMSHQFKGNLGNREDKTPTLDDLRGHQGGAHIAQSVFGFVQQANSKKAAYVYCLKHRMRDRNGQRIELFRNGRHGYQDKDTTKPEPEAEETQIVIPF